ncbi:MAG: ribonuclease BN, partial [Desulfococcus sp. 4484_241]
MYKDKTVCVVIPAFNEQTQIPDVLTSLPEWIDHIVVVDDASTDDTAGVVEARAREDSRIVLLRHKENRG